MAREQVEREDKYDVPADFVLPDLSDLVPSGSVEPHAYDLVATYFDTSADDLRRHRLTLRRRTGGHDDGWHLKLPGDSARIEITVESAAGTPPPELTALLRGVRLGHRLVPRAKVTTTRRSSVLIDAEGGQLTEVTDDRVHAETLGDDHRVTDWREVEVELGQHGDEMLLARVGELVTANGARVSDTASKVARAMGPLARRSRLPALTGVVDDYLQRQYDAIVRGDLALRRAENSIHPTRVAARRLRSILRVFAAVFDRERAEALQTELAWYAGVLGGVRDLDVQADRLTDQLSALPPEYVVGLVASDLKSSLTADRADAWRRVGRTLDGARYLALLRELDRWRTDPPFVPETHQSAPERVAGFVDEAEQDLARRLRRAVDFGTDDELFHRARKGAKRYRYANELAEPVLGKAATRATEQTKQLQTLLGEHQDSVVSAALLQRLSARASNGFTYGVLAGQQLQITSDVRAAVISTIA